jgi:hypothetical protein
MASHSRRHVTHELAQCATQVLLGVHSQKRIQGSIGVERSRNDTIKQPYSPAAACNRRGRARSCRPAIRPRSKTPRSERPPWATSSAGAAAQSRRCAESAAATRAGGGRARCERHRWADNVAGGGSGSESETNIRVITVHHRYDMMRYHKDKFTSYNSVSKI